MLSRESRFPPRSLRSNPRIVVPAKERSTVETGLRVKPPMGVWGRFRAVDKRHATHPSLDVCPGILSEEVATENMSVDVVNSSENDLIIEPGDVVAVVQFYSGLVCVAEVGDVLAPVPENKDSANLACGVVTSEVPSSADHPQMPLRNQPYQHRNGDTTVFWYSARVARPVDRKERAVNAKAMAALDKEWNKLIAQKCWDYASVREWKEVAAEADRQGIKAHVGRIFEIYVAKTSNGMLLSRRLPGALNLAELGGWSGRPSLLPRTPPFASLTFRGCALPLTLLPKSDLLLREHPLLFKTFKRSLLTRPLSPNRREKEKAKDPRQFPCLSHLWNLLFLLLSLPDRLVFLHPLSQSILLREDPALLNRGAALPVFLMLESILKSHLLTKSPTIFLPKGWLPLTPNLSN